MFFAKDIRKVRIGIGMRSTEYLKVEGCVIHITDKLSVVFDSDVKDYRIRNVNSYEFTYINYESGVFTLSGTDTYGAPEEIIMEATVASKSIEVVDQYHTDVSDNDLVFWSELDLKEAVVNVPRMNTSSEDGTTHTTEDGREIVMWATGDGWLTDPIPEEEGEMVDTLTFKAHYCGFVYVGTTDSSPKTVFYFGDQYDVSGGGIYIK